MVSEDYSLPKRVGAGKIEDEPRPNSVFCLLFHVCTIISQIIVSLKIGLNKHFIVFIVKSVILLLPDLQLENFFYSFYN